MNNIPTHPLEQFLLDERNSRIRKVLERRTNALRVVIDQIHHTHNIAAVLRSADAFGVQHIDAVNIELSPASGVSLGSERWLTVHHHKTPAEAVAALLQEGFELVILEPPRENGPPTIPVHELPFERRLALIFGNEKFGVSQPFREAAAIRAHIPMFGFVESFNISVAAAITLFCSTVSGARAERRCQPLSSDEAKQLHEQWLKTEVRGADGLMERLAQRNET